MSEGLCIQCGRPFERRGSQKLCGDYECFLAQKRVREAGYRRRKVRLCEMCEQPLPFGLLRYHQECWQQKEAVRLKLYYWRKVKQAEQKMPVGRHRSG